MAETWAICPVPVQIDPYGIKKAYKFSACPGLVLVRHGKKAYGVYEVAGHQVIRVFSCRSLSAARRYVELHAMVV